MPDDIDFRDKIIEMLRRRHGLYDFPKQSNSTNDVGFNQPINPEEEQRFQTWIKSLPWFSEFTKRFGKEPNLDPGQGDYDYRAAFRAGITPEIYAVDNLYHWPSVGPDNKELKAKNHPTAWMNDYMVITGRDPLINPLQSLTPEQIKALQFLTPKQTKALEDALKTRYGDF